MASSRDGGSRGSPVCCSSLCLKRLQTDSCRQLIQPFPICPICLFCRPHRRTIGGFLLPIGPFYKDMPQNSNFASCRERNNFTKSLNIKRGGACKNSTTREAPNISLSVNMMTDDQNRQEGLDSVHGPWEKTCDDARSPLVVSLSRTRNVPLRFSRLSRSLSESRRVILPKYHLVEFDRRDKCGTRKTKAGMGRRVEGCGSEGRSCVFQHTEACSSSSSSSLPGI